jgi:hypothetical protein
MLDTEDDDDWTDGVCQECDRDEAPTHDCPEDADPPTTSSRARIAHCRDEAALDSRAKQASPWLTDRNEMYSKREWWDKEIAHALRTSPTSATVAALLAEANGRRKARLPINARFVNLTAKQKALAKRLAYLIVVGDYGRGF